MLPTWFCIGEITYAEAIRPMKPGEPASACAPSSKAFGAGAAPVLLLNHSANLVPTQSTNLVPSQSATQPVNQPVSQPTNQSASQ